ncbi:tRNA (uridine-5-oxyacetic acid methyl ester) 34 synthase [Salinispira pacifica]|uniref:tRNA (Uridine-5-oxyacetic acid methyl ester) 34 synthase n=2 Tax=Salinispira pacifica TaxID=1307761 RepID=V5WEC4_9SPIO|nr:tRNA (uridine-5-oxyacetic acid methyl ester) 34 synthase [Salinispira pacifica]
MIKRSVPGYADIIDMIGLFARHYVQHGSNCYDLGASLGAATLAMRRNINVDGVTIHAVDNSADMLKRCGENIQWDQSRTQVELLLGDVEDIQMTDASMVVLNFTLQFIPAKRRQRIVDRIFKALRPGGVCIISEKLVFPQREGQQEVLTHMHLDFKRMQGYSDLEISQKRQSLENVLVSNSSDEIIGMFDNAGFSRSFQWFQYLSFASFFAAKATTHA